MKGCVCTVIHLCRNAVLTLSGSVRRSGGGTVSGVFLTVWDVDEKGRREAHMAATQNVNSDGTFDVRYLARRKYFVTAVDTQTGPDSRFVGEHGLVSLKEAQWLPGVAVLLKPQAIATLSVIWARQFTDGTFLHRKSCLAQTIPSLRRSLHRKYSWLVRADKC